MQPLWGVSIALLGRAGSEEKGRYLAVRRANCCFGSWQCLSGRWGFAHMHARMATCLSWKVPSWGLADTGGLDQKLSCLAPMSWLPLYLDAWEDGKNTYMPIIVICPHIFGSWHPNINSHIGLDWSTAEPKLEWFQSVSQLCFPIGKMYLCEILTKATGSILHLISYLCQQE